VAYTKFDPSRPDGTTQNIVEALDSTRLNLKAIRDAMMFSSMPDWAMEVVPGSGTYEQPEQIKYTRGVEVIRLLLTWNADGNVTQVVYQYSNDSGNTFETVATETINYDAEGNVTGTSWS